MQCWNELTLWMSSKIDLSITFTLYHSVPHSTPICHWEECHRKICWQMMWRMIWRGLPAIQPPPCWHFGPQPPLSPFSYSLCSDHICSWSMSESCYVCLYSWVEKILPPTIVSTTTTSWRRRSRTGRRRSRTGTTPASPTSKTGVC